MMSSAFLRFAPLALMTVATAAPAQFYTVPTGSPVTNPTVPPGEVGQPGGRSGSIEQSSSMGDGWRRDLESRRRGLGASGKDAARPAKEAELVVGAEIADNKGADLGYIKSIEPDGVVVATVAGQVRVPTETFGKNSKGLLIGMGKAEFDKLVVTANGG